MNADLKKGLALGPYKVLDLTEQGCMLGGRILADLGAEVIKIEPPGGSPSRIAPFYKDVPEPEKSLYWFAYNFNKRGVTLNLEHAEGQRLFKRLVQDVDIVLESFAPGYLGQLGLGYADLKAVKPDIIMTSITPYGQEGPKSRQKGSDLTVMASSGYLYICGDELHPPTWISFPQASLFGGAEAAAGSAIALYARQATGKGQYVDVSMQECCLAPLFNVLAMWTVSQSVTRRLGGKTFIPATGVSQNIYYPCKDGYVMILVQGGGEPHASSSRRLVQWMDEEGLAADWLKKLDWAQDYDAQILTQDLARRVEAEVAKFTLTKTKAELYENGGIKKRILIAPVSDMRDIDSDLQLKARHYWSTLEHPELPDKLTYCGPFIRMSETPLSYRNRAPLIGEHNREVYIKELGYSLHALETFKQNGVI